MKIDKELRKMGINPSSEITVAEKDKLIENVVINLINTFPTLNFSYNELTMKLYHCKMYRAKIDSKYNKANYIYKNKAIYFDETLQLEEIDTNVIHECIHCLQDIRKENDKLYRIGLCEFNEYKVIGLGLNEMLLQYITKKVINQKEEENKNILDFYAEVLLNQVIFLFGEEFVVKNAINAEKEFEEEFMNTFQEEEMYYELTTTFDKILEGKQQEYELFSNKTEEGLNKIDNINHKIYIIFEKTQANMFDKYFNTAIRYMDSVEEVEEGKQQVLKYRNLIKCYEEEEYKYDKYVEKKLELLDKKFIEICRKNSKNTLTVFRNNPIINLLNYIRKAFFKNETY